MTKVPAKRKSPTVADNKKLGAHALANEIRLLIDKARADAVVAVNAELTVLYWRIGQRIRQEVLGSRRAAYGEEIVLSLSRRLTTDYGRGFSANNLRHMLRFANVFPDETIVYALRRQLSWTHFRALIYIEESQKRSFYAEMCRLEGWSTRILQERIDSQLFERTLLSRKPGKLIEQELGQLRQTERISPALVLKDPYLLDFLDLADHYVEKDFEDAILREMELFLLEMGAGFSFIARQKRIQIDQNDFYIDLLFYNRRLNRLVAVELKLGEFKAEYKGQMELYLRWLAKHEQEPGEAPPLGIILCTGKRKEQIELLELDASGIHVAEYLTALPARELWTRKLHEAIERSQARLGSKGE